MKYSIIALMIFFVTNIGFAQTDNPEKLSKQFSIYTEGDSGNLTKDVAGQFVGNSLEVGLIYEQNFSRVTWLSMYIKTALKGNVSFNHRNLNTGEDFIINPNYVLNGVSGASFGASFLEIGMHFSEYGYIALRHNLLIKAFAYYPIYLPNNIRIKFMTGIEARPYFIGVKQLSDTIEGEPSAPSIENIMIGVATDVGFAKNWNFLTSIEYRTDGGGTADRTASTLWKIDSFDALKYNSKIRWDNILSYKMDSGLSVWGGLRYEVKYFVPNPAKTVRLARIQHQVYLRGGLIYTFDFAKL